MVNIVKIYMYIFPILLAFIYPQAFSKYHLELSLFTFIISITVFFYKIKLKLVFKAMLVFVILLIINILFTNNNNSKWYSLLYIFSSLVFISNYIYFIRNYSDKVKRNYERYLEYIIYIFMLMPIYNYITRPMYHGGNQMMYYIVGIYLLYLATSISRININKNYFLIFTIILFDLFISKNRGSFPLILSLIMFNIFLYHIDNIKYTIKNKLFKINIKIIFIFILGLVPILMYFGIGESLLSIFATRVQIYSDEQGAGRLWLFLKWMAYFNDLYINNTIAISPQDIRLDHGPHNTFLYLLYNYNILGIVMYFTFLFYIIKSVNFKTYSLGLNISFFLVIISISMLLNTASLFLTIDPNVWIGIILFFYSINRRINVLLVRNNNV
jgi:hypothetical protein